MKNPTPRQISAISAGFTSLFFAALFLLILAFTDNLHLALLVVPAMLIGFVLSYLLIRYYLDRFIYRKIKVIYKTIHNLKASRRDTQPMRPNIIDDVEKEVVAWAEEKSKEIAHMNQMEEFRREFVGNVAHELKTPIFNIQGYLDTLIEGDLQDDRINLQYLRKASANVDRLMAIVNDLTTINTLESGKQTPELSTFDIRQLALEVFESLEMQAESNGVTLGIKEGCDRPFQVRADRNMIRQVLVNLLSNTIKYARENDGVSRVGFYDMADRLLVEVSDNGIGMNETDGTRVFERFYRADSSRSRDRGGTGLGLSIVKHIIEAHGQTVNVRSALGVGSTFGFTLAK